MKTNLAHSSETLLELSLTRLHPAMKGSCSLDIAWCFRNFWKNSVLKPQNWNIRSQKGKDDETAKKLLKFSSLKLQERKRISAKIDFYVFLHFLWNCCFVVVCCRCKWQKRIKHTWTLFSSLFLWRQGLGKCSN